MCKEHLKVFSVSYLPHDKLYQLVDRGQRHTQGKFLEKQRGCSLKGAYVRRAGLFALRATLINVGLQGIYKRDKLGGLAA